MSAHEDSISSRDYARLCDLIYAQAGIHLGSEKKTMLEVRIKRRIKALELSSFGNYCNYLFGKGQKDELIPLINVVATNKTDFFREPRHFEFLIQQAIGDLTADGKGDKQLLIWSAGCSTGEEPYTLAIVLSEYALTHPGFRFRILATDISTTVLSKASEGVYSSEAANPVPSTLKRKYFMRSRDSGPERVRIVPELRNLVQFRRLNFMDSDYGLGEAADAIFCRNVIIYFDRPTQAKILNKLTQNLVPCGYLFVGHAETLHDMDLPLEPVAPSLYRKTHD
jgi:chemotaxis protein methyltransferase CheR